jgi:hypothetical protein
MAVMAQAGDGWDLDGTSVAESDVNLGDHGSVSIRNPSAIRRISAFAVLSQLIKSGSVRHSR